MYLICKATKVMTDANVRCMGTDYQDFGHFGQGLQIEILTVPYSLVKVK
jgi:hypothetical protein